MLRWTAVLGALAALAPAVVAAQSFVAFESGQVRPLAMSPDGTRLFAVNTPDNRLEIFDVQGGTLAHQGAVPVGLEPVAVAARSNGEVWVVNHLSDSVSIVDVGASPPRVTRTLLVGDEPRDVAFADGTAGQRAYVTTARRGQNAPVAPALTTPGVGRALVWALRADRRAAGHADGGERRHRRAAYRFADRTRQGVLRVAWCARGVRVRPGGEGRRRRRGAGVGGRGGRRLRLGAGALVPG
jgi:YVTN family beta-propeller protein